MCVLRGTLDAFSDLLRGVSTLSVRGGSSGRAFLCWCLPWTECCVPSRCLVKRPCRRARSSVCEASFSHQWRCLRAAWVLWGWVAVSVAVAGCPGASVGCMDLEVIRYRQGCHCDDGPWNPMSTGRLAVRFGSGEPCTPPSPPPVCFLGSLPDAQMGSETWSPGDSLALESGTMVSSGSVIGGSLVDLRDKVLSLACVPVLHPHYRDS